MRRALGLTAAAAIAFLVAQSPRTARATGVIEFPDNGSEQEGRGGAWVARASDPLAAFYNPAGLAGQPTRLTLQANISTQNTCFTRIKAAGDTTNDGVAPGQSYPQVCQNGSFFPNPQLAFTYRINDRLGVGIAVLGPSAVGSVSWPEFQGTSPAPQRYLLISSNVLLLEPSIGVGWEALDGLRIGASFIAGTAPTIDFVNAAPAQNIVVGGANPADNDIRNELKAKDVFIPGFTLGAIWSPLENLDVAGWYKWTGPIDAKGDVTTAANYFTPAVANGNTKGVIYGDTALPNCNNPMLTNSCGSGNNGQVKVPLPMEAKLGLRFHVPRSGVPYDKHLRDPIAQDLFDVEADFTWANDSAFDAIQVRFPVDANGNGLPANPGIPGGTIPPNADVPHHFKDVFGVRLGGDYNVLPDQLALRAGAFYESSAVDPQYQNIDFDAAQHIGLALGGTYRIKLGAEKTHALDLMLAYGHVFFATMSNTDPNAAGLPALAGRPCPDSNMQTPGGSCPGGSQPYRTPWPVNLGTITSAIDVINVGASYKF